MTSPTPVEALPAVPEACSTPEIGALPFIDDDLPTGAIRLWLCGGAPEEPNLPEGSVGKPEPLTTDVDAVVAEFNAFEKHVGVMSCAAELVTREYTVVVEYADGHRALRTGGCNDLRDATNMFETYRDAGERFLDSLDERWAEQREEQGFVWEPPSPSAVEPTVELSPEPMVGLEPKVCADVRSGALDSGAWASNEGLPEGVARAWLCGDRRGFGGVGPIEPLTTDPDRIVAAVNALPFSYDRMCTDVGGPAYAVVLDYPDGRRAVVGMDTVNCQIVGWADGRPRTGGGQLAEDVTAMWQQQRESTPEPFTEEVPLCEPYSADGQVMRERSMLPVQRAEAVRGVVCGIPADATGYDADPVELALPSELLMSLGQDALQPAQGQPGLPYLVLLNQFGDPMVVPINADGGVTFGDGVWQPATEQAGTWGEILDGLRMEPL